MASSKYFSCRLYPCDNSSPTSQGELQLGFYGLWAHVCFRATISAAFVSFLRNAFHGYSHNFSCQTKNYPDSTEGAGLEDFEMMERVFSSSNAVVGVTRYASAYHRGVFIDMFFQRWDDDKYQNLGLMLLKNYKQALSIISDEGSAVLEGTQSLGIQSGDLETWHQEYTEFFKTIGEESSWDIHAIAYVELLKELNSAECSFSLKTLSYI